MRPASAIPTVTITPMTAKASFHMVRKYHIMSLIFLELVTLLRRLCAPPDIRFIHGPNDSMKNHSHGIIESGQAGIFSDAVPWYRPDTTEAKGPGGR